jgi:hypothetical protein
LWSHFI